MYTNTAYLNNNHFDNADVTNPLTVKSCGNFRLTGRPSFTTFRPGGRRDFQLLYIASGKTHFYFDDKEVIIPAGNVVLYRPHQIQKYIYYAKDKPTVFWIHFSGTQAEEILSRYNLDKQQIFHTGIYPEFDRLFLQIIGELQSVPHGYRHLTSILLCNILLLVNRLSVSTADNSHGFRKEIDRAIYYFNNNYSCNISIEEYASSCHTSLSWFIRNFKKHTGVTPMQYILSVRITNAQTLLESTDYTVGEIASIVGYDNSLYFSRLFKKQTGMSPLEYRKHLKS